MSTKTSTRGDRTTCDECGLPYYADENDACPYCTQASHSADSSSASTEPEARSADTTAADAGSDETDQSLLQRLSNRVRNVIGSV